MLPSSQSGSADPLQFLSSLAIHGSRTCLVHLPTFASSPGQWSPEQSGLKLALRISAQAPSGGRARKLRPGGELAKGGGREIEEEARAGEERKKLRWEVWKVGKWLLRASPPSARVCEGASEGTGEE